MGQKCLLGKQTWPVTAILVQHYHRHCDVTALWRHAAVTSRHCDVTALVPPALHQCVHARARYACLSACLCYVYYGMLRYAMLCHAMLWQDTRYAYLCVCVRVCVHACVPACLLACLCCAVLCRAVPCCAMLCYAMLERLIRLLACFACLCLVMLCYAMPRYVRMPDRLVCLLAYAMLCYAT